jgi:hypothetical protein
MKVLVILGASVYLVNAVAINGMSFMQVTSELSAKTLLTQVSHNCNSNIDRLKKGPVDWTKIEGSGKEFTDMTFPAD